ncbi:FmdB family zinc ribbon protein [Thermodesulfobacteriota bacterium]
MPIYEYRTLDPEGTCSHCREGFEVIQQIHEKPTSACPLCGEKVKKIISWCRSAVVESSDEHIRVKKEIKGYEKSGMWSHAAELADIHSEQTDNKGLKTRALENYKKAGYDADSLARHSKTNNE